MVTDNKLVRYERSDEHVSTWVGNVDFGPSFNVLSISWSEVALDSFAVDFWGRVVLYSIVFSSVTLFS